MVRFSTAFSGCQPRPRGTLSLRRLQGALAAVSSATESDNVPHGESLETFLSRLPGLWRQGEIRPLISEGLEGVVGGEPAQIPLKEYGVRYCTGFSNIQISRVPSC